jgi:hypothetical protein
MEFDWYPRAHGTTESPPSRPEFLFISDAVIVSNGLGVVLLQYLGPPPAVFRALRLLGAGVSDFNVLTVWLLGGEVNQLNGTSAVKLDGSISAAPALY